MSNDTTIVRVDTTAFANEVTRLSRDINQLRNQGHDDAQQLREQFHNDTQQLREQFHDNTQQLKKQFHNDLQVLQGEVAAGIAATTLQVEQVRNEVSRGIEADAQTKLFEQYATIANGLDVETRTILRLRERYEKSVMDTSRVLRRYDSLNDKVKDSYHRDIRKLGQYIFEIWEKHFQQTVESRIVKQHTGFLTAVLDSIDRIRAAREKQLATLLQSAASKLDEFLHKRQKFQESIDTIKVKNLPVEAGQVALPAIALKRKGDSQFTVFAGHEVAATNGSMLHYQLQETDLLHSLRSQFQQADDYLQWRPMSQAEIESLASNLQQLLDREYITQDYYQHLIQALQTQPPMLPAQVRERRIAQAAPEIVR